MVDEEDMVTQAQHGERAPAQVLSAAQATVIEDGERMCLVSASTQQLLSRCKSARQRAALKLCARPRAREKCACASVARVPAYAFRGASKRVCACVQDA